MSPAHHYCRCYSLSVARLVLCVGIAAHFLQHLTLPSTSTSLCLPPPPHSAFLHHLTLPSSSTSLCLPPAPHSAFLQHLTLPSTSTSLCLPPPPHSAFLHHLTLPSTTTSLCLPKSLCFPITVIEQRLNKGFPEDAPVVIYKLRKEVCPRVCLSPLTLDDCYVVLLCSILVAVATLLLWLFTPCRWLLSVTSVLDSWGQMVSASAPLVCLCSCFLVCLPSMTKQ